MDVDTNIARMKMQQIRASVFVVFLLIATLHSCFGKYNATWESIDSRPLPKWYDNGKIGICAYWGIYSVPSNVNEWMWYQWKSYKRPNVVEFMKENYKPDFTYQDFAPQLTAEFFDPDEWMDLFEKAGAKYVLLTSKHHEGYSLWPSKYSFSWNSMDVGPNRDLVGEFAAAAKKRAQLKFGVYYSLFEWYHPLYLEDLANNYTTNKFVKFKTMPMFYELVQNYSPELLWSDGDWMVDDFYFDPLPFLAWLYNESPVKDSVVINDRWGKNVRCKHGGYWTCHDRYNPGVLQKHKWENVMFLDKSGSGFRRTATLDSYLTMPELLTLLASTVSCGGNLLIDVGITVDGRIPPIIEERLTSLGDWLKVNGEAIYESQPWTYQNDTRNKHVWYTMKENVQTAYAILLKWPDSGIVSLAAPVPAYDTTTVEMLGLEGLVPWSMRPGGGLEIKLTGIPFNKVPSHYAWVFKLNGLKGSGASSRINDDDDALRFKPHH